jgi:hypothetical protein
VVTSGERTRRPERSLDAPWVTASFALAVALLTWDPALVSPATGLDASWILALNLGAASGLDHGTEFVFTYGPLGFLEEPLVVDGTLAALGAAYLLAARAALAATLLWAARRSLPWAGAALVAFVVTAITPSAIVPLSLAITWSLVALQDRERARAPVALIVGGGALAALELMVKLNIGLAIALIVAVTVAALPGPRARNLLILAGSFLGVGVCLWFASGQSAGNFDDYLRSSYEVISGYSETSQVDVPAVDWDWAAALLAGLGTIAAVAFAAARAPLARRLAMLAVAAVAVYALEKYGFVRHDPGHVGAYFAGLAAIWVALEWTGQGRVLAVGSVALIAIAFFATTSRTIDDALNPKLAVDQLRTLIVPGDRAEARDDAVEAMRSIYDVDPRIIGRVGDEPVDARPWEVGIVWAYGLDWRPLPVVQDYLAYTPTLDRLNADALAASDGPRFLIRHFGFGHPAIGADGRFIHFDAPLEARVILCEFRPVLTRGDYQLLERSGDRCGEPRPLETVHAGYGEAIAVPEAARGDAVIARVDGATATGAERLRSLLYRPAIRYVVFDGTPFRFTPRNAESGLLIAAPRASDFPKPFALAPNPRTIAIESEGGLATSAGPLRVEFLALPLRGFRHARE